MVSSMPKWATADRQDLLVKLFVVSKGFCVYGHPRCTEPAHYYEVYIERLIRDWKAIDKEDRAAEWKFEQEEMHRIVQRERPIGGHFDAIAQDAFYDLRPTYYRVGMGMSGVTLKPFVAVRLPSSAMELHVNLGDALKPLSKNARHKAVRYGKRLPADVEARVRSLCFEAVRHYQQYM